MIKHYDVMSPDGISINRMKTYETVKEAGEALDNFVERYKAQGYYSSNDGRIPLEQLAFHCNLVTIKMTAKEIVDDQVNESFEFIFDELKDMFKLSSGDISPNQVQRLEKFQDDLSDLVLEWVEQNSPKKHTI